MGHLGTYPFDCGFGCAMAASLLPMSASEPVINIASKISPKVIFFAEIAALQYLEQRGCDFRAPAVWTWWHQGLL